VTARSCSAAARSKPSTEHSLGGGHERHRLLGRRSQKNRSPEAVLDQRRSFALATLANFLFFVSVTSFFSLPVELERLGADRAQIGRIVGVFGVSSLVGIPLTGSLVDRHGRRPFMIAGALLWALSAFGFAEIETLGPEVYLLRLAQGMAFSLAFVALNALVVDLAPRGGLGKAIALFGSTTLLAHAIGPSLGEWLALRYGFAALFRTAGLVALVPLGLFFALPLSSKRATLPDKTSSMLLLALRPGARSALAAGLTSAVAFGTAIHFMPVYVRARGLESHAPFFIAYVVSALLVRLFAGGLGDRIGHRRVGAFAALAFSVSVMACASIGRVHELAAVGLAFGAAHGWGYPSCNALFVEGAPETARGRAMALFNLSFNVGMTIAAFAAGELAERFGYSGMWLMMGAAAGVGALALSLDRGKPEPLSAPSDRA
jgi:MFS family permease